MNTERHYPSPLDIWKDILMGAFDELFVCGPCGSVVWGNCPKHRQNSFKPGGAQFYMRQSGACYELCHCCGAFPIKNVNGPYKRFCSECEDEVRLLNARLGRCAVPTGYPTRHNNTINASDELLADLGITPPELGLLEKHIIEERQWALQQAERFLDWWSEKLLRLNLTELGWDKHDSAVPLATYLSRATQHIDKADRFRKMCMDLNEGGLEVKDEREQYLESLLLPPWHRPDPRVPEF